MSDELPPATYVAPPIEPMPAPLTQGPPPTGRQRGADRQVITATIPPAELIPPPVVPGS